MISCCRDFSTMVIFIFCQMLGENGIEFLSTLSSKRHTLEPDMEEMQIQDFFVYLPILGKLKDRN